MARSASDRQERQRRHRKWLWSAGPPANFLDDRTDVAAAYSLRLLRSNYTGPLVRLRRSSDNAELDFRSGYFLNFSDVSGWAGGDAFATTFYDQSGRGRNLVQASASAQPKIIQASNGRPALLFDGSNDIMKTSAFTLNQPWSFNLNYRRVSTVQTDFENILDGISQADAGTLFHNITGTNAPKDNSMYAGTYGPQSDNGVSMAVTVRGLVGGCFNGASSLMEINATTIASFTGDASTRNAGGLAVGCRSDANAGRFTNMEAQELLVFNTAHASAQIKADNAAVRAAWGF